MSADPYKAEANGNDPTNPQSWNRFAHVLNDPVNKTDPTGLLECDPDDPDCAPDPCDEDPALCEPVPVAPPAPPISIPSVIDLPCPSSLPPPIFYNLAAGLGATEEVCQQTAYVNLGTIATSYDLEVPLSNWNQLAAQSGFLPPLVASGGLGTIVLEGGEITIGVMAGPEVLITIFAGAAIIDLYNIYRGRQGNVADTGVEEQMQQLMSKNPGMGVCEALKALASKYAGDKQMLRKIRRTEKQYGCSGGPR